MSAKRTPGPWGIMGRNVGTNPEDPIKWSGVASVSGYGPESDANLALVSAAPDLLDALEPFAHFAEAVVRFAEGAGNFPKEGAIYALHGHGIDEREITVEHFRTALSAIAKARGEA